jgi:hypothetical protein
MQTRTRVEGLGGNRGIGGMAVAEVTLAVSPSPRACDRRYLRKNDGEPSASCADSSSGH